MFLDEKLLGSTSNAVESSNRRLCPSIESRRGERSPFGTMRSRRGDAAHRRACCASSRRDSARRLIAARLSKAKDTDQPPLPQGAEERLQRHDQRACGAATRAGHATRTESPQTPADRECSAVGTQDHDRSGVIARCRHVREASLWAGPGTGPTADAVEGIGDPHDH